jgi:hypothetical protein
MYEEKNFPHNIQCQLKNYDGLDLAELRKRMRKKKEFSP